MEIRIKYHNPEMPKLSIDKNGDWIDLRSAETVHIRAGEHCYISLGISVKLPEGYEAHIAPRSSTFAKWGLLQTNCPGIIDNRYSGTNDIWKYSVYATRDTVVHAGDRICQFRIVASMPALELIEADALDEQDRGGFGSTGYQ